MSSTVTTARLIDDDAPARSPDGELYQGSFYFWLGDDGVEDDPNYGSADLDDESEADFRFDDDDGASGD